ncbi:MAG: helix-turn-helix transcriptional regulator [Labilithrix sp.]
MPSRIDVDRVAVPAFGLAEDHEPFDGDWHAHDRHQLLFAAKGTLVLTTDEQRWTLPPERAAWIGRKVRHRAASSTGVELRTVYLTSSLAGRGALGSVRVFGVNSLAREMLLYAMRWGPHDREYTPLADAYFRALGALAREWIADERPYHLPVAKSAGLAKAMAWVDANLGDATVERAAEAAKVSVRTLSRRFEEETSTSFRAYLQGARMMRAMELLARRDASVSSTAHAVGFQSIGAFTTAFTERCGETPSAYRARRMT